MFRRCGDRAFSKPHPRLDPFATRAGRPDVPPRWSFGSWQSKISYRSDAEGSAVVRSNRDA
jgi:alpha-D-xyloside xylohydrolase